MNNKSYLKTGILILLLTLTSILQAGVWEELNQGRECNIYRPLSDAEIQQAEAQFREIFNSEEITDESLSRGWVSLGYGPVDVPSAGEGWVGLVEQRSDCRGQGFFLINRKPTGNLVVQAPHASYDRGTGEIIGGLLRDEVAVLGWNSTPRKMTGSQGESADLAKRWDSLFSSLSRALAKTRLDGRLVQIHGFSNRKRKTPEGSTAAAIISSGTPWVSPLVEEIAGCLNPLLDDQLLIYPTQIKELGGTQNVQGQVMRSQSHLGFVHLELNPLTREWIRDSRVLLEGLGDCLSGTAD